MRQVRETEVVDYAEHPPPAGLAGLVKAFWCLDGGGDPGCWIDHQATPDGCVELIARVRGRSRWGGEQPPHFVTGLINAPIAFAFSGDARFVAARLWPWAWMLLDDRPVAAIRNVWAPVSAPAFATIAEVEVVLSDRIGGHPIAQIGESIIRSGSVAEMRERTGMTSRTLQRWFARHVGMPPRRYLALLRFQNAFADLPARPSLAGHAADHGFADQAHMARAFRDLAGLPASQARKRAKGPFLD